MEENNLSKELVNNEYDFSNIIPTKESISYLVNYFDQMNKQLTQLVNEDEEKNKPYKDEFKEYMYKKMYTQGLDISIIQKNYNTISCSDYNDFLSAVNNGSLKNINKLTIDLVLDYKRGKGNDLEEYNNAFSISFKPYEITFSRKSNHNQEDMNNIEKQIINILNQFKIADCIFCDKSNN